jgi:hypothetical protein
VKWIRQPAVYAWQAAHLLAEDAPPKKVETALRETFLFWAKFDNIDVPPLLRRADVQAFEETFRRQLQYKPRSQYGANAAALDAVRQVAWELGWVPF